MADAQTESDRIRRTLEALWGCGPGEMVMGELPDPETGDAMPAPVAQLCVSSAHNYAYWAGSCEFATDAALAVTPHASQGGA